MVPLAAVVVLLGSSPRCAPALADELRFGMNRVNLAWLSPGDRRRVVSDMAANGVKLVRLSLTPPVDESINAVSIAHEHDMRILLEIPLGNKDFYPVEIRKRSGLARIWDMYRLSDIDLQAFRAVFSAALQRIDKLGIALLAIEPGNEINLGAYNGDLSIYPHSNVHTARSLAEVQDRRAFETGIDKYVMITRIVREELSATTSNREAKIISAGLSDMSAELADRRGIERLEPAEVMQLLQARGIEEFIDAYGIHFYPNSHEPQDALQRHSEAAMSFCATAERGKPCWLTEWGVANLSQVCPLDDGERERIVLEVRSMFEKLMQAGRLATAFYFDWDSKTPYSTWRCSNLTPAGRAAIAPAQ
jgi:hypothetical protein